MPARILCHVPEQAPSHAVLGDDRPWVLGRQGDCDVVLAHGSVSRQHARVSFHADAGWTVTDLGAKNGVRMEGERIASGALGEASWFALGDVLCEFSVIDQAQADALAQRSALRRASSIGWQRRIEAAVDARSVLAGVLEAIVALSDCRRGFLLTVERDGEPVVRAWYAITPDVVAGAAFSGSRGAVERALHERRMVLMSEPGQGWLLRQASVVREGIRSLVALPLQHEGSLVGVASADSDDDARVFTQLDAELLEAFAGRAASALAAADLQRDLDALQQRLGDGSVGAVPRRRAAVTWSDLAPPMPLMTGSS